MVELSGREDKPQTSYTNLKYLFIGDVQTMFTYLSIYYRILIKCILYYYRAS